MRRGSGAIKVRSTPLRLTGTLILIFTLSALISFAVAYWVVRSTFDAALTEQLHQTFTSFRSADVAGDLVDRLSAESITTDPGVMILQYWPDSGSRISNVDYFPPISGVTIVRESDISAPGSDLTDSYLATGSRVGSGHLIVAQTREQVAEMGEIFQAVFLIGLLPTIALAAAAGLFVARRANAKIDLIQQVLSDLTSGQLQSRVNEAEGDTVRDTDDLTQISIAVNRMASAQEALVASLRQVSADIAHDLKTPIQRVAVILEQITKKTSLSEEQNVLLGKAMDETDRIVKTFDALLQVAQIEGGALRNRFVATDLNTTVDTMVDLFGPEVEESGFHLDFTRQDTDRFTVLGDRHLLGQVLANLIENSLRHVPKGGRIGVALTREENRIVLSVCDDGPGIPAEERQHVLQRLYRLERSRHSEGNGLGLSLVAAVCDLHHASLTLEDNAPGLRVQISFPSHQADRS